MSNAPSSRLVLTVVAIVLLIALYSLRPFESYVLNNTGKSYEIARQGIYPAESSKFSSHHCIQTGRSPDEDTRCHFRNVCIELNDVLGDSVDTKDVPFSTVKPSSVRMFYYRPEEAKGTPLYWHARRNLAWSWVRIGRQSRLTPELEYHEIPANSIWSPAKDAVLTESFWPENFAHSLADDFFPVYRIASAFGLWSREVQVIMHPDCSRRGDPERGCSHHAEMSKMLIDRPLETLDTPLLSSHQRVCFKNLLVGTRMLGDEQASETAWPSFVAEIKSHYGFQISPRLRQQKITMLRKNGRRTFLNYEEVADHLRNRFEVEVEIYDIAQDTIEGQIRKLETTTVLISPCGGISFSALFLPPGSSAIFANFWFHPNNISYPMDAYNLAFQPNFTPFQYELEYEDLSLNRSVVDALGLVELENNEELVWRSYANVTLSVPRIEKLVFSALLSAQGGFEMNSDSFKM